VNNNVEREKVIETYGKPTKNLIDFYRNPSLL